MYDDDVDPNIREIFTKSVMDEDYKWDDRQTEIKHAINNLLWMHMPGKVTLDEAENIACEILDIFFKQYDRFDKETNE